MKEESRSNALPSLSDLLSHNGGTETIINDLPSTDAFQYESIMICIAEGDNHFIPLWEYRPVTAPINGDHYSFKVFTKGHRLQSNVAPTMPFE